MGTITQYRMATHEDLVDIYENFDLTEQLGFPVFAAIRGDKVIGFLGTQNRKDMVVAGPLEVDLKNKAFVCTKLVEGYDNLLRNLGIAFYWFSVNKGSVPRWLKQVAETGLYIKIDEVDNELWFERRLV